MSCHCLISASILAWTLVRNPGYSSYPKDDWRTWKSQLYHIQLVSIVKEASPNKYEKQLPQALRRKEPLKKLEQGCRRGLVHVSNGEKNKNLTILKWATHASCDSCLLIRNKSFTSNTPWPINCPVQQNNWAANTTWKIVIIETWQLCPKHNKVTLSMNHGFLTRLLCSSFFS